jgi:alpha-amylase/alpha-mannosidase (GH57 family)
MTDRPPLSILFLWHQHQPLYKDLLNQRYELPWVRLHATKDYVDMAALLEEFPKIKANFNLVPSLLAQLDDYATGKARDVFIDLTLKNAADLTPEDKLFLLKNFFMANWGTMIEPWPRYRELLERRGYTSTTEDFPRLFPFFKEQDWRDLQMWFNLAWMDPYWREKDPDIRAFFAKGRNFTEDDKKRLIEKQTSICAQVVSKHKELQEKGQIEITATPFYHPILPLLCDTEESRMAMPSVQLPRRFQHPEDARLQIRRAIEDHEKRFGQRPRGFWPSEGSVSETVAQLFMEEAVRWIATDEAILEASLKPAAFAREDLYEPYTFRQGGKEIALFFRDHALSDAIGFVYGAWDPHDAAKDFIRRLKEIQETLAQHDGPTPRRHIVPVILDGENCWEYYREDGLPFLRELYRLLSEDPTLQTVLASDYLDEAQPQRTLNKLASGSWINGNFAIWIGHSEDNRAWDLLSRTRDFLTRHVEQHPKPEGDPSVALAWEEILVAEGSDWCWWYGADHSSASDETFDALFRQHLINVYSLMGEKPPEDLRTPIKALRTSYTPLPPTDFLKSVRVDGRVTNYFEWLPAGVYQTAAATAGAMHRVQNLIRTLYYGFDLENLYLRIDFIRQFTPAELQDYLFRLTLFSPEYQLDIHLDGQQKIHTTPEIGQAAYDRVLEIALPLAALTPKTAFLEFSVSVLKGAHEHERWPTDKPLRILYPTAALFDESWSA